MWPLLAVPSIGALALLSGKRLYCSWGFGAGLVLLLFLAGAIAVQPMSGDFGAFNIYPEDAIFAALFLAAALRLSVGRKLVAEHLPWLLFGIATAASFVIGSQFYGLKPAGVEYRSIFYVVAGGLYCGSFRLRSDGLKQFVSLWLWTAGALLILASFRWMAELADLAICSQWAGVGGANPIRVLNANQALFLSQAFLVTLYLYRHTAAKFALACFSGALLLAVILLEHRSVWVATAAACGVLAWREKAWKKFMTAVLLAAFIALPVYFLLSNYAGTVSASLRSSVEEPFDPAHSTIAWRTELWQQYIFEFIALNGAQTWFGTGFGNPATYDVEGNSVSNAPHNYFVYALNRAGVLGLVTLILAYGMLLYRVRGRSGSWDYLGLFLTITASQLVFFMAYAPSFEQGLVSGAILGLIPQRPSTEPS
jgi:hypothetical protein